MTAVSTPTLLTIFGTTKPMQGDAARIQSNALGSWSRLAPGIQVLLIGDDFGAAELADELGIDHLQEVQRSPLGVPLLSDLFAQGQARATGAICVFANADIIFTDDLMPTIETLSTFDGPFLAVGQRWDVHLDEALRFDDPNWGAELRRRARIEGRQDSSIWIDWFAFGTNQMEDLPPFVVGRPGYDHWLVANALQHDVAVIDASDVVMAIHQHHEYNGGRDTLWSNPDSANNRELIGPRRNYRTIANATHRIDRSQSIVPATGTKYRMGSLHAALGPVLEHTASARQRIGLDVDRVERMSSALTSRVGDSIARRR
jgi:hypothetical protein